jgi:hypothetical protein
LKAEMKDDAIYCRSQQGPIFCSSIIVTDNCNTNTDSFTYDFSDSYTNDFGLKGSTFLIGSPFFQVKYIEIFEIAD